MVWINKKFFCLLFFLPVVSLLLLSCEEPQTNAIEGRRIQNLKGYWKFSIGDNREWALPDYDDSNWEEIYAPSSWENEGFHGYNGFAWYRRHFDVKEDLKGKSVYLYLGYIDDVDEVYINGYKVGFSGSFLPAFVTAYNVQRKYYIPENILSKNEKNLIAVRVYDSQLEGGIISGELGIYINENEIPLDINLAGQWKFALGDMTEFKDNNFDDSDWHTIIVPGFWEHQGFPHYDGFAWYRKDFTLPKEYQDQELVLLLGKIDDFDQIFINGSLVGYTGEFYEDMFGVNLGDNWQKQRAYVIPKEVLQKNQRNIIAVRVYDGYLDGGIYQGPIGIVTRTNYNKFWKK
jgi:sialate O-acetylesterase